MGEGGGGGGGGCDMARAVQQALRRDPLVHTAVEGANRLGKAVMMWNGDWVRSGGQDGKGLSAVREAIMWEVAFAPEACRNERMHGRCCCPWRTGARASPSARATGAGRIFWVCAKRRQLTVDETDGRRGAGPIGPAPIHQHYQDITTMTTRRFCARPVRVLLSATGSCLP